MQDEQGGNAIEPGSSTEVALFGPQHLEEILRLCEQEGWETLCAEPGRTLRALSADGVVTLVAIRAGEVVGFAQALSDGEIQAYLSRLLVAASKRRQGIGERLLREVFLRSGAQRVDLLAAEGSEAFYASFPHGGPWPGYRIHDRAEGMRDDND
jgi:ribosomal protein S18 acetylase RimI-like enzyme